MNGHRDALLIANEEYEDARLSRLASPVTDVAELKRVLSDPKIGNFAVDDIQNEPDHKVRLRLGTFFSNRRSADILLLHFSCHGLKNDLGELFLAARNTLVDQLAATAVSADFIYTQMRDSRAGRVVLLLDCCYGGAFSEGLATRAGAADALRSFAGPSPGSGRGLAVITASDAVEFAFEGGHLTDRSDRRPSVFTSALVSGLATGEADSNEDGQISVSELYEYVQSGVKEQNPNQTPTWRVSGGQGNFIVASSPRRRILPATLPVKLEEATHSSEDYYRRLGAVTELQSRLHYADLSAAAGALEALRKISLEDTQDIAQRAKLAIEGARLTPAPNRLDFGRVKQNEESPHHLVRLLGPPLAQSCVVETKPPWLRVHRQPDSPEFDAWLDTSPSPGSLSGEFTLASYVGKCGVPVEAVIEPAMISTGISFVVEAVTRWGEGIYVVGDDTALGAWEPDRALPLSADDYPRWHVEVDISPRTAVEYKYIRRDYDTGAVLAWESGANRTAVVPVDGTVSLSDSWA